MNRVTTSPCGVLCTVARGREGVRNTSGFTQKRQARGGAHLGLHCNHRVPQVGTSQTEVWVCNGRVGQVGRSVGRSVGRPPTRQRHDALQDRCCVCFTHCTTRQRLMGRSMGYAGQPPCSLPPPCSRWAALTSGFTMILRARGGAHLGLHRPRRVPQVGTSQ